MVLSDLEAIVGAGNVLSDPEILDGYSRDMSFVPSMRPKCVIMPGDSDQVLALVKWANEARVALVPVSSGGPHFRGDTVPGTGGAVIVNLSRMKRITKVDRENRVVMIEPGIAFGELAPKLAEEGLRLNIPHLPKATKSVIGSLLEREPVIMPLYQWDAIDPLACIEVVFGTGDLFRTGSAAGPGTLADQWRAGQAQVNPMGPGQTDFARMVQGAQGTIGIVTWASVRCETLPLLQEPFLVGSDDFGKLADLVYRLLWLKSVDECLILNKTETAMIIEKNGEECTDIKEGLPNWLLFFSISGFQYFPEEKVAYQKKDMLQAATNLRLEPVKAISKVSADELLTTLQRPSDDPYWKLRYKGARGDIFFLTTLDKIPKFVDTMYGVAKDRAYPVSDIGVYIQPMVQGTSCHCEFGLPYNPNDKKETETVRELHADAHIALMNEGAFFSRPYDSWANSVYRRDGETTAASRKTKSIFDPNNIMNPGKLCF